MSDSASYTQVTGKLINLQDAIVSVALAIWHYPNELYTSLNCFENCQELAERALNHLPSAEPPTRCIAEVKFDKQDLEELVNEKIEEIKEIKSEHEDFLNFLCNVINPNDMEEYLAMYNSKGEAEG